MALFNDQLAFAVLEQIRQHWADLGEALGADAPDCDPASSPLLGDLRLLIDVANGRFMRSDELTQEADAALERVLTALTASALVQSRSLTDAFWESDLGVVAARVRWWVSGEDLITISNAAALAFGANNQANRMRIARAMDKGLLDWVPDPSVANPQQNRRVLRAQVERLRELRNLPD